MTFVKNNEQNCHVSATLSKLSCTNFIFVKPAVKINGSYYHLVLLIQELLPAICDITGEVYMFQQAHHAGQTI